MEARDLILNRVRGALGRTGGPPAAPPPPVRLRISQPATEEKLVSFCSALERLAARAYVAESMFCAGEYVREVVAGRVAVATDASVVRDSGITYPAVEISKAEVGITGADYGLADTGTLVVLAKSDPRLVSLLPPVHIALLRSERLLSGLDELFTILPEPAGQTASMVLITGPSRTADIEQILVRGVHGPGELHVVILP